MPFWIAFAIMAGIGMLLSAVQYLLRPKAQKGDVFDSKTYHIDGMDNSTDVGSPVNIVYGTHQISPQILSYLKIAKGDYTRIEVLCSCGEGPLNGLRSIKVNDQPFFNLFSRKNSYYRLTMGKQTQLVYESRRTVSYELADDVTPGFNKTITVKLAYSTDNTKNKYQNASSNEPGYIVIGDWASANKDTDLENVEIVKYTGKAQQGGTGYLQLTGCRVTKNHTGSAATVTQYYKKLQKDNGAVYEHIPGFNKTVVHHNEVDTVVTKNSPVTITTENKIQCFAITIGFESGLYNFSKTSGYKPAECTIAVKWWKDGTSWSGTETEITKTRTKTADDDHYIKLEKNKNHAWLVDSGGNYVEGTEDEISAYTEWDKIEKNDVLKFTLGGKNYECKIKEVSLIATGESTWVFTGDGTREFLPKYRYKIKFKQTEPEAADKYQGPKADKVSYEITYKDTVRSNYIKFTIAPDKAKLSNYRYTYILPDLDKFDELDYAKYKIQLIKISDDTEDEEKSNNKLTLVEIQEMTIDKLVYPYESLLALQFNANEKVTSINRITAIVEGRLLKDVQNPGNDNRLSNNFYDILYDTVTNKRYGRGKNINLTTSELTDYCTALSAEAAFCDQEITENSKTRKRMMVDMNVDFKKPLIDLLQATSVIVRGGIFWDGVKPLCYTDRSTTPSAMFGAANIVQASFASESYDLSSQVNRIYSKFLNRHKNYKHDSIARDFRDENFDIRKVRPKDLQIYGITDRWRASKNASYILRVAKYLKSGVRFQTGNDALTIDIAKTFYYFNKNANCGRILAVGSNNITLDKQISIESGKTYKGIIRKDDGTPHSELTVDVGATGIGNKNLIYFTASISGVTLATYPIYAIGVDGDYYEIYRCVKKEHEGNAYEITGALYNAETYRIYKNDPSSDPSTNDATVESDETVIETDTKSMFPPNILSLKVVENLQAIGAADIYITRPVSSIWARCDIYLSDEVNNIDQFAGTTRGEPLRIQGLKLNEEYTLKAISFATNDNSNPIPYETTITLEGAAAERPTGLQIVNNRSNETDMFGRDFEVKCNDMTSNLSGELVKQTNTYEAIRYYWEVYYSAIPGTVKLGEIKANSKVAYSEITRQNRFKFSLENNIESTKTLWKNYQNTASSAYDTYYGNPQRTIKIRCYTINAWGKMSEAYAEITLTNPAPDMKDENGAVMTPTLRKIKSGLRIEWNHPWKEYDITHFVVKLATNSGFTTGIKRAKIASLVNVDSSDEDVSDALYKTEIDGLNPETTYYVQVIPHDAFGKGAASNASNKKPGLTHDDDEEDKARPAQYNSANFAVSADTEINDDGKTVTHLVVKGLKATETDADGYILEYRAVKNTGAATPPTGAEVDAGVDGSGNKVDGNTYQIGIDGEAGTGTTDTNYWKKKINDVKNNWKYFFRVRTQNTSGQKGAWSNWASFVTTKANNASDTTAPNAADITITKLATSEGIEITVTMTTPPADLAGFRIAVKANSDFTNDADRVSNIHSVVDSNDGKAKVVFYGSAGTTYYITAQAYDNTKNYSAWKASETSSPTGATSAELSKAYSLWRYKGSVTSSANNKVSWTGGTGNELVKKKNDGTDKEYTVTAATNQTVTNTMFLTIATITSTTATFQLTAEADLASITDPVVIAKIQQTTGSKCTVVRYVDDKGYSVASYKGGFNRLSAMFFDAENADLGNLTIQGTGDSYIKIKDAAATPKTRLYLASQSGDKPVLKISKAGYNADTETDPDHLLFSSEFNNFKIIDQGVQSVTIPSYNVSAGSYNSEVVTIKSSIGITTARGVVGFADIGGGYTAYRRILPITSGTGNSESFTISIAYSPDDDAILCSSEAWNWGAGTQTVAELTFDLAWYLLGETLE